ncbi:MAG: LuxR family transcriptional regulator [Alphaproteobacteria bacterium]|nr:LuxR family transcriptional regulator [Alphaproteobacteria bacterium]
MKLALAKHPFCKPFAMRMKEGFSWGMCDALFTPQALGPVYDIALGLPDGIRKLAMRSAKPVELFPMILSELGKPGANILIIEDIHWADYATLDFIKYIGRRISILSALLIVSFRNDEIVDSHPAHSVFGDLPPKNTVRLDVIPLSLAAVETMSQSSAYDSKELHFITGGNPFFVSELLSSQTDNTTIPISIKEAVNTRLNRLSIEERQFLEFASIIPGAINIKLLEQALPNAELLAMACVGRSLLKKDVDGSLRFRHELARLATHARIASGKAQQYHVAILKVLLSQDDSALTSQIVHHAAGAGDSESVLIHGPIAANHAASIGSHREAAGHLATALKFVDKASTEQAAILYEQWAYEAGLALSIDEDVIEARRHAVTLWRALGRMEKVGDNLRWLSRLLWYRGEAAQANRYADEAVRILENEAPSKEKAMAFSLRSQMHVLNGRMELAIEWGERALKTSANLDTPDIKIHALNNIGTAKIFRGNTQGLDDMNESLRLAKLHHYHEDAARVYTNLAEYAVEFKDFDLAEKVLSDGIAFDTQHDLDAWTFYLIGRLAQLRLEQGRLSEAVTVAEGVLERKNQTLLMKLPALTVLAKAKLRLGAKDSSNHLQLALENALSTDEPQYIMPIRSALIEKAWYDDTHNVAEEHFEATLPLLSESSSAWVIGEFFFWARKCGLALPDWAARILPEPYQIYNQGKKHEAFRAFKMLKTDYAAAACICDSNHESDLLEAYELARGLQSHTLIEKIKQAASIAGLNAAYFKKIRGPYRANQRHPLNLTQKELQVLGHLVNGSGNQKIADELSRSKRTIENHVASIFRKMNTENRIEVILRVQNEPWILKTEGS